jgi:lycopene beta-cyclase
MTRLSTGYTFLNIQEQSKYIRENIENIKNVNLFKINSKYDFLDKIFIKSS